MKPTRLKPVRAALLVLPMLLVKDARAQRSAATVAQQVQLTTQGCAQVKEGDVLIFDWNPGFEHPGAVVGMQKIFLRFARRGQEQAVPGTGGILLSATKSVERASHSDSSIAKLDNGYFRATFLTNLQGVEPGEYYLTDARGDARLDPRYSGDRPQMTNSPLRSPYCLNVIAPPSTPVSSSTATP